jgi:hypothetical protein
MPRIERFFANQKVADWTSGSIGAGAGGGDIITEGGEMSVYPNPSGGFYTVHWMTSSTTFYVHSGDIEADILLLGAGGTAGISERIPVAPTTSQIQAGGGGAGAWVEVPAEPLTSTGGPSGNGSYPIVIGAGSHTGGTKGGDTTAFGSTAPGGGKGGSSPSSPFTYSAPAWDGGSGGGAPGWAFPTPTSWPQTKPTSGFGTADHPSGSPGGYGNWNPGSNSSYYVYVAGGAGGGSGPSGTAGSPATEWPSHPSWAFGGVRGAGSDNNYRTGSNQKYAGGGYGGGSYQGPYPDQMLSHLDYQYPGPEGGTPTTWSERRNREGSAGNGNAYGPGGWPAVQLVYDSAPGVVIVRYTVGA